MAGRGRPPKSEIRQNIVKLLSYLGSAYGYEISKIYPQVFSSVSRRVIYYHLKKGVDLGIFEVDSVENESGDFSWGRSAKKVYYTLGENSSPRKDKDVEKILEDLDV